MYITTPEIKKWIDKHIPRQAISKFHREAVQEKIDGVKRLKAIIKK